MTSEIITEKHEDGSLQRLQVVKGFPWSALSFEAPPFSHDAFSEFVRLYEAFIIPKAPEKYGTLVFFHVPDEISFPFSGKREAGTVFDRTLAFALLLEEEGAKGRVRFSDSTLSADDAGLNAFISMMTSSGWLYTLNGKGKGLSFLPLSGRFGFQSHMKRSTRLSVNSHFFIMELPDRDSPYDLYGEGFGLAVKDGAVLQPPLFGRESLLVGRDGRVSIGFPCVRDLSCEINGKTYVHGKNAQFFSRPECRVTPASAGTDIIVIGNRSQAFHDGGVTVIPSSGFVISSMEKEEHVCSEVHYGGLEDYVFAIQTGPMIIREGRRAEAFMTPYFSGAGVSYPPTSFPLDFVRDEAPRIIIGADWNDEPVIIWAEGRSKLFYDRTRDSRGLSLSGAAKVAADLGLKNAITLDGGGSALMLLSGKAHMHVSGRYPDNSDAERPVPFVITVGY